MLAGFGRGDAVPHPYGEGWQSVVALEGSLPCIARARRVAAGFMAWAGDELAVPLLQSSLDLVQLVVSELVTNAVRHAPGPLLMRLRIAGGRVGITVWDREPSLPVVRGGDPARPDQHGLEIVRAVAQDLTVRRERVGKRVTAHIALTAP